MNTLTVSLRECINALLNHMSMEPGLLASLPSLSASVLQWSVIYPSSVPQWSVIYPSSVPQWSVIYPSSVPQWSVIYPSSVPQWHRCQCFQFFGASVTLSHRCSGDISVGASSVLVLQWHQCRCFQRFSDQWHWGHQCGSDISVGDVGAQ